MANVVGTALIFATLVLGQGEQKLACDIERGRMCYSGTATGHGLTPLTNSFDKNYYLENLCRKGQSPDELPAESACKGFYLSCNEDEKKKFATMERGYTALHEATSDSPQCKSVVQLRDCLDLEVMKKCNVHPENKKGTSEGQQEANKQGAENLKGCLKDAAKGCEGKQHASGIAQLNKIASAIVDLNTYSDGRNSASRTNAAMAVVAAVSLSWLARGFY